MGDLPLGNGHEKYSDPRLIEATGEDREEGRGGPPQPEMQTVNVWDLEAQLAGFRSQARAQDSARLERIAQVQEAILRQLKEMNYYILSLALGKKPTEEETLVAIKAQ